MLKPKLPADPAQVWAALLQIEDAQQMIAGPGPVDDGTASSANELLKGARRTLGDTSA